MESSETAVAEVTGTTQETAPHTHHLFERRGDRRDGASGFHFPERRTGFDRRRDYAITGFLRDRPHMLAVVLIAINALSAVDFAFTYVQIQAGVSVEGNPLLAEMFAQSVGRAWLFKTVMVGVVTLAMWMGRRHRSILAVAAGTLVFYALLIAYHLIGMRATGLI